MRSRRASTPPMRSAMPRTSVRLGRFAVARYAVMNWRIVSCILSVAPIAPFIELLYSSEPIVRLAIALTFCSHCESRSRHGASGSLSLSAISDLRGRGGSALRLFLVERRLEDLADRRLRQRLAG